MGRPASQRSPASAAQRSRSGLCAHQRAAEQHGRTNERLPRGGGTRRQRSGISPPWDTGRWFLAFGKAVRAISHLLVTRQSIFSRRLDRRAHSSWTSPRHVRSNSRCGSSSGRRRSRGCSKRVGQRGGRAPPSPALWLLVGSLATCSHGLGGVGWSVCLGTGTVSRIPHGDTPRTRSPATKAAEEQPTGSAHVCVS